MSRPADAVFQVTEQLRVYWTTLEGHKRSFAEGGRKEFYELVQQCVEQLLVQEEEQRWQTDWRKETVWRIRDLDPGEEEKRIREKVRPWLQAARRLKGWEWWFSTGIHQIGDDVDAWFGAATDPVKAAEVPKTVEGRVVSVSSPGEQALRRRVAELEQQKSELVEEDKEKKEEIATLTRAMHRLKQQLKASQFTVGNLRQQIALLEKMVAMPPVSTERSDARMPATADMRGLLGRMEVLRREA